MKLLRPELTGADSIARFEREVRVTATLNHPNTIAIYDYGRTEAGAFYYAMEYLDGIDLESLVASFGALPAARVIHLLRQACGALGESHGVGVVHRDIKLANLYLCARGGVRDVLKVLDFGLVKANEARVTRASVIVGTPENMAPELFESAQNASPVSDVYALGCVAYTLVTGRRPFEGASLAELCNAHLTRAVVAPSRRLGAAVDPSLERLILACLAKRARERPQSMEEIVTLLERSPVARAWTRQDADLFWTTHKTRIEEIVRRRGEQDRATPRSGGAAGLTCARTPPADVGGALHSPARPRRRRGTARPAIAGLGPPGAPLLKASRPAAPAAAARNLRAPPRDRRPSPASRRGSGGTARRRSPRSAASARRSAPGAR